MTSSSGSGANQPDYGKAQSVDRSKQDSPFAPDGDRIVPVDYNAEARTGRVHENEPLRPQSLDSFTPEHAGDKTGPVIVPFGLPGSGKSTFLATLFKLLSEARALQSEVIVPDRDNVANYAGQAMLNEWNDLLTTGRFVRPTNTGDQHIRDVEMQVTPLRGTRRPLRFSIVEVAGEDLRQVIVEEDRQPSLPAAVEALFDNRAARPMLILMVHPERSANDKMFDNLMVYLRQLMEPGRMADMPMLILIPNPRRALADLHERRPDLRMQNELSPELCPEYLKEFAPRTSAIFSRWPKKRRGIMPYYVGTIGRSEREGVERIMTYDDRHARQVFKWIYFQFTGRKLGHSWYTPLLKLLDR